MKFNIWQNYKSSICLCHAWVGIPYSKARPQSKATKAIIMRPVSWTLLLALAIILSQCEGRPGSQEKKPKPEDNKVEKAKKKDLGTDKIAKGKDEKCSPDKCDTKHQPVCASDGKTYNNKCLMEAASCKEGLNLKIDSEGQCPLCLSRKLCDNKHE